MSDKAPREKVQVEPNPDDPEFFEWLERLFDGPTEFPELIDVFSVYGRQKERPGPRLDQIIFAPAAKETKEDKREAKVGEKDRSKKPSREELVALSNRIRSRCQRDCSEQGKPVTYGAHASHFARGADYYARFIFTLKPKGIATKGNGHNGEPFDTEDDEDGLSSAERYYRQKLSHDERMFHAYGAGFEGLLDRQDRALEREAQTNEKLRMSNERLLDMVEKLQSNQHERNMQLAWQELKMKSVEKGLDLALGLAPPIINQLTGKKLVQNAETAESITLKAFFKAASDGGKLTVEQADAAFGKHDNDGNLLKPGVLSKEQVTLLFEVAHCTRPVDDLDHVMPGGRLEVTGEQVAQLQQIFSMEQIAPVVTMIMFRMQNRQQTATTNNHQPQQ